MAYMGWNQSIVTGDRVCLFKDEVIAERFEEDVNLGRKKHLLSEDHFRVDGTLIQAWDSQKSVRSKDDNDDHPTGGGRNAGANVHQEKRSNETHESKTDGDARLARKGNGKEAKLSYMGPTVMGTVTV